MKQPVFVLIAGVALHIGAAELDPLVITGTKTAKTQDESPISTTVITRQQIQQQQASTLAEVLQAVPGLHIQEIHGQNGGELLMQGMTGNHILILKDGIPVRQSGANGTNLSSIGLSGVSRIEVVPGNASALYGNAAMGGVINLITEERRREWLTFGMNLRQNEVDSSLPSEQIFNLDHGVTFGQVRLSSQWQWHERAPYDVSPTDGSEEISGLNQWSGRETIDIQHASDLSSRLWLNIDNAEYNRDYDHVLANQAFPYRYRREDSRVEYGYRLTGGLWNIDVSGDDSYLKTIEDNLNTIDREVTRTTKAGNQQLLGQRTFMFSSHDVTTGMTLSREWMDQKAAENEVDNKQSESIEWFVQDDWYLPHRVELITGLRSQWNNDFGFQTVPNVSLRWDISDELYLRAGSGLGYRVPNLKERYYRFDHSIYGYEVLGNSDLKPELAWSSQLELGYRGLSMAVFYKDLTNLIDTELDETVNNGIDTYRYSNIGSASIVGANVSFQKVLGQYEWQFNHQWLQTEDSDTGLSLNKRPDNQTNLQLSRTIDHPWWKVQKTRLSVGADYTGEQYYQAEQSLKSPDYLLFDATISLTFSNQLQLSLKGSNLSNVQADSDQENDLRPIVGRQWSLNVIYHVY
ncbi:TonB-dependent receptor plug domain-containing protein [Gynuella sunshinyii]|uniref:Outer membrane cobalamin receptor protein n=1 Tax=Gynuella sunshinyii YC6258 TaxID=1445510 RepID=A0A0C5V626_9GAMM|nr:TonB-dependent receptor [Gynuella sunshinyii]AJQ94910.1 outer membrane cobalamin receptor protein [Gynuella sunshinyii YC6258]